jgi:hypothetical protein
VGSSISHNPIGLHGLYGDGFTFSFIGIAIGCVTNMMQALCFYSTLLGGFAIRYVSTGHRAAMMANLVSLDETAWSTS